MFYVLLIIVLREHDDGKSVFTAERPAIGLSLWDEGDVNTCGNQKLGHMMLQLDRFKKQLPDKFQPIRILLDQIHEEIFSLFDCHQKGRAHSNAVDLNKVIAIFDNFHARFGVP